MSEKFILPTGKEFDLELTSGGDDTTTLVSMTRGTGKLSGVTYTVPAHGEVDLDVSIQVYALTNEDVDQFNKLVSSMLSGSYKNTFDASSTTRSVEGHTGGFFGLFGGSAGGSTTTTNIEEHMGVYGLTDEQKSEVAKAFFMLTTSRSIVHGKVKVFNRDFDYPVSGNLSVFVLDVVVKSGSTQKTQRVLSNYPSVPDSNSGAAVVADNPVDIASPPKAASMFTLVPRGAFQHELTVDLPPLSLLTRIATIGALGIYGFLQCSATNTYLRTDSKGRSLFASAVNVGEALKFRLFFNINKTNLQISATVNDMTFYLKRSNRITKTAELSSSGGEDVTIQWKDGTSFELDMDGNAADVPSTATELKIDSKIGNGHAFQFKYFDTPANPTMIANVMHFEKMRIAAGDGTRHPERI